MQNTTTTVIAICLAATLLFVAPLVSLTERNDNVVQENVELLVNEFVTDVQNTGIINIFTNFGIICLCCFLPRVLI